MLKFSKKIIISGPTYKFVKTLMPHCPNCKEQLQGTGSEINPWSCNCGIWKCSLWSKHNKVTYYIKKKK